MAYIVCAACGNDRAEFQGSGVCQGCYRNGKRSKSASTPATAPTLEQQVSHDRQKRQERLTHADLSSRYKEALKTIDGLKTDLDNFLQLSSASVGSHTITPKVSSSTSEATIVATASDWHIEENVGAEVNGLNRYNLEIANKRAVEFFQHTLRLTRLLQQDVKVPTMVLALLGDFITNNIHGEENAELNEVPPIEAMLLVQDWIVSGLNFLLNQTKMNFVIPCHSGNHARTTLKTRFSAENGHSLEYFMYVTLARLFANEPRVTFLLPAGIHSYVTIYDKTLRFHHGHAVNYGGGVGGIYIPVNKAIAQWNKGRRADLDVFGHFHQLRDGGNFICNGSLIGYNGYAMSIKADYEPPKQSLFLIDKKRGRTCHWPILFTV